MPYRIIETGQRDGLAPNESGSSGTADVYRYVTFVGERDDVHTIFVAPDHPLTDAKALVDAYYEQTLTTDAPAVAPPTPAVQPQFGSGL